MNRDIWELINDFEEHELRKGLKHKTAAIKKTELSKFFIYLEEKHPGKTYGKVETEDIRTYLDTYENLSGKPLSSYLYNRGIFFLSQFYDYLIEREEALFNPAVRIEHLPVKKGDHRGVFTEEEIKSILGSIDNTPSGRRDRAIIELLYSTGIRLNELVNLDLEDINFETREIFIRHGKGDKERIVPIGEEALKTLKRYTDERHRWMQPGGERKALFFGFRSGRVTRYTIEILISKRKRKAGVCARGSTHAFRHSMASHMLSHGAPLTAIQRILGHEHINTTKEYVHLLRQDMQDAHKESHPKAEKGE